MLTVRDWAATLSMSRQAGYLAVSRCKIPVVDGLVDAEAATALYRANTRARARNRPPASEASAADSGDAEASGYSEHRARRERAEADLRELELAERRGGLVDIAAVRAELGMRLAQRREQLLQLPARLAPLMVGDTDQARLQTLLDGELRQVLAATCALDSSEAGA